MANSSKPQDQPAQQQPAADDYVIATGESHSVKELVEVAFGHAGLDWQTHVTLDPALIRPAEVDHLIGDAGKARRELGWAPSVDFRGLVENVKRWSGRRESGVAVGRSSG